MDLINSFSDLNFLPGRVFLWSPSSQTITYDPRRIESAGGQIALLHEIGHARLDHRYYKYDMELLRMEMDAWDVARDFAPQFGLAIDEAHIAGCIASYDEWLSKRATCPGCHNFSLQRDRSSYRCFACGQAWRVNFRMDRRVKRTTTTKAWHELRTLAN